MKNNHKCHFMRIEISGKIAEGIPCRRQLATLFKVRSLMPRNNRNTSRPTSFKY